MKYQRYNLQRWKVRVVVKLAMVGVAGDVVEGRVRKYMKFLHTS